jgi:hypothetical protein
MKKVITITVDTDYDDHRIISALADALAEARCGRHYGNASYVDSHRVYSTRPAKEREAKIASNAAKCKFYAELKSAVMQSASIVELTEPNEDHDDA